jgi:hypothetical protein
MKLDVRLTEERWAMREPFEIAGQVIEDLPLLLVEVRSPDGTSLGMAPAFLVAQLARWIDLVGPLLQAQDRDEPLHYQAGTVHPPYPALWG